jgi:hypothetical protein
MNAFVYSTSEAPWHRIIGLLLFKLAAPDVTLDFTDLKAFDAAFPRGGLVVEFSTPTSIRLRLACEEDVAAMVAPRGDA